MAKGRTTYAQVNCEWNIIIQTIRTQEKQCKGIKDIKAQKDKKYPMKDGNDVFILKNHSLLAVHYLK